MSPLVQRLCQPRARRAFSGILPLLLAWTSPAAELLPPGHRPEPPGVHALVDGKVFIKPGEVLDGATIVLRDGFIEAVGRNLKPPADARVWDMKGATIYAGFIDAYLTLGAAAAPENPVSDVPHTATQLASGGINFLGVKGDERDPGTPGPGERLASITPEKRVADGYTGPVAVLRGMRELGFTSANIAPEKGILRGTSAFVALSDVNPNEAILKADTFQHIAFEQQAGDDRTYPGSLMGVISAVRQAFLDARHYAADWADYRQRQLQRKRPAFNPANEALAAALEKRLFFAFEPRSALMADRAARIAREADVPLVIVASGQEWRRADLMREVNAAFIVPVNFPVAPKLPEEDDWTQISLDQLRAWDWAAENAALLRREGRELALTTYTLADRKVFRKNLRGALDRGLSEADALAALTTVPARICGLADRLGTIEKGKLANLTVVEGSYFDTAAKVREVWIDGRVYRLEPGAMAAGDTKAKAKAPEAKAKVEKAKDDKAVKADEAKELAKKRVARAPQEGRGPIASPKAILVKNATLWTSASQGVLTDASLLVADGKIQQVGQFKVELSADTLVIDAAGRHVTAGLIDAHSHTAILGGVNEGTIPSSAMVRIGDVVNSETANLYQQLAGGLTTANLLHGSANPIGGQNSVIKLRDGATPESLKFEGAPSGIKFALGENVKQSNWGDKNTTRFPQTRMGVGTFFNNRFTAARQYLQALEEHRRKGGVPPRRDLELEAIGEIIRGERLVHCHSYRQDEILAFLRTMESFGVRVGTLQHVLEGYKVADEIARHGAGASCFSDWWAYKFEVIDAIPYAGSLMAARGANVSFNSDSSDLARRMYLEAAKAVKYGGTREPEALNFVTINPARQLGIEKRVGSLEPGKDADFVIWSKSPLDSGTVCEQTWIDGKKYFDITQSAARAEALQKERSELIAKAKKLAGADGGSPSTGKGADAARAMFFQRALETAAEWHVVDCQDCKREEKR
jgi:imidazolonepropionase-like amidohydrolase